VRFRLQGCYLLRPHFPEGSPISELCNSLTRPVSGLMLPATPTSQRHRAITRHGFRLFPFRSPLLRESRLFSLPRPTEMCQFRRFASWPYVFRPG